jgi:hypothetical protein
MNNNPLNCSDINEFEWILKQKHQIENSLSAQCSDGTNLWDLG